MENFRVGECVRFIGCDKDQTTWGSNNDPSKIFFVGNKYYVEKVEVHSWHTKLTLRGISGRFNSVCFEKL
jgi:hypothetical protein